MCSHNFIWEVDEKVCASKSSAKYGLFFSVERVFDSVNNH
jgi:hypothetical protein